MSLLLPVLYLIAILVVASLILYFVKTAPDAILDGTFKWIIRAVVIIVTVILVIYWMFGMFSGGHFFPGMPH